jgi:hypothetical protein
MDAPETTDDARVEAGANLVLRTGRIAAILFALCLLYILSIGPVSWLILVLGVDELHPTIGRLYEGFYAPVIYLGINTPLKGPFDWYCGLWVELAHWCRSG